MHKTKNKRKQKAEWKTKQDQTNRDGANIGTTNESEQLP